MNKKRKTMIGVIIIGLFMITIGYAYLSQSLKINGAALIDKNEWKIEFTSIDSENITGKGTITKNAEITSSSSDSPNDTIEFGVNLSKPGDTYTLIATRGNLGSIDAVMTGYEVEGLEGTSNFLKLDIIDPNGSTDEADLDANGYNVMTNPDLLIDDRKPIKVVLTFKSDITKNDLLATATTYNVRIKFNYQQKF